MLPQLLSAQDPYAGERAAEPRGPIDNFVFSRLETEGIEVAKCCSDVVFVRRVFIDTIGTLPQPAEVREFLRSTDPEKRAKLIDALLVRDEFADCWANKWSDLLRVKAEFPINLWPNAAQAYHRWLRTAVRDNMPYDQFVRALLCSNGSNFREAPVNFYRALQSRDPKAVAQTVALSFMGCRAERWPEGRLEGMGVFFSQLGYKATGEWKEEIVFHDPSKALAREGRALFPDGTPIQLQPGRDPREVFADWLVQPDNPWFSKAIANRVWAWLMGRGLVEEVDDLRSDNPPVVPEVLELLARELVDAKYDLRHLFRVILNSETYQLSSRPSTEHPRAATFFASYPLRRLDAEVLIDALNQITGTHESYTSAIPEPFTFVPANARALGLPDGSISSPFLELFGRPSRDTGLESERNNRFTPMQRLHLLNSSHIRRKIEQGPRMKDLQRRGRPLPELIDSVHLLILSRLPSEEERRELLEKARAQKPGVFATDLVWALINSNEFLHRH